MNKQNEKFTELTPEQMDKVSGGAGSYLFCCPKCRAEFTNTNDYIHHRETCLPYNYVDPNPQPAPLPKPDEKIEPAG